MDQQEQIQGQKVDNYLEEHNGAFIIECSSELPNAPSSNLISSSRKNIWMSAEGMPQYFIIDISQLRVRPTFFKFIGFDCWHDYKSNPAVIELLVSTDGTKEYITWSTIYLECKEGLQVFAIDRLGKRYGFIKILVKETFGSCQTYLNSVQLFQDNPFTSREQQHAQSMLSREQNSIHSEMNYEDNNQGQGIIGGDRLTLHQRSFQTTLECANQMLSLPSQNNQTLITNQTMPDMAQQVQQVNILARTPQAKEQQKQYNQSSERRERHHSLNSVKRYSPKEQHSIQSHQEITTQHNNNLHRPLQTPLGNRVNTSQKKQEFVQNKEPHSSSSFKLQQVQQHHGIDMPQNYNYDQYHSRDLSNDLNFRSQNYDNKLESSSQRFQNYHAKEDFYPNGDRIIAQTPSELNPILQNSNLQQNHQFQDSQAQKLNQQEQSNVNNIFERANNSEQHKKIQRGAYISDPIESNPPLILTQSEKEIASLKNLIISLQRQIQERDARIEDSERRIYSLERALHSILSRTSALEGIIDTLQAQSIPVQRESQDNSNNKSNYGEQEKKQYQIEEFRTSQKRSFPLSSPQTFGKGYNNENKKGNSIDCSPLNSNEGYPEKGLQDQVERVDKQRIKQKQRKSIENEEVNQVIQQKIELFTKEIAKNIKKNIDIPESRIHGQTKQEKAETVSQRLRSEPEQLPKRRDSKSTSQKTDSEKLKQNKIKDEYVQRNNSKSREIPIRTSQESQQRSSEGRQLLERNQKHIPPSTRSLNVDKEHQKQEQESAQNPRVFKLLEKLQEKLQMRSQKVDELNSGKDKQKKNERTARDWEDQQSQQETNSSLD